MTLQELLNSGTKKLSKTSDSPALDSEVLLSFVLKKPKEYLYVNPKKDVRTYVRTFIKLINKRTVGWPVAYLINQKEFYGLNFYVDKNVLIPRPETEGLVDLVSTYLERSSSLGKSKKPVNILDIGTGSGNIITSLAKKLISPPFKEETKRRSARQDLPYPSLKGGENLFFASDISKAALNIARKNAKQHKVKVTFKQGSLLKPWKNQQFDIIVANLPYLAKETHKSTKFEPKSALIAAKKGLKLYEELFKQISPLIPHPSTLFLEIGHDQGLKIKKLATKWLPASRTQIYKDLSKKNRYAVIQL